MHSFNQTICHPSPLMNVKSCFKSVLIRMWFSTCDLRRVSIVIHRFDFAQRPLDERRRPAQLVVYLEKQKFTIVFQRFEIDFRHLVLRFVVRVHFASYLDLRDSCTDLKQFRIRFDSRIRSVRIELSAKWSGFWNANPLSHDNMPLPSLCQQPSDRPRSSESSES